MPRVLTAGHLAQAVGSPKVRDYLVGFFQFNTAPGGQILVYGLLDRDSFDLAEAHRCLEKITDRTVPLQVIERLLLQLVLYGLIQKGDNGYAWTIPLVRDKLQADSSREYRMERLLAELPEDFGAWITPSTSPAR